MKITFKRLLWVLVIASWSSHAGEDLLVPPGWQKNIIYANNFDGQEVNPKKLKTKLPETGKVQGCLNRGIKVFGKNPFRLTGAPLSPDSPKTISFWWALTDDAKIDGSIGWFQLKSRGKGMVVFNSRGKGKWCALKAPAGVLQAVGFRKNKPATVNHRNFTNYCSLKKGIWHHTAIVFCATPTVEVYIDGKLWRKLQITGPGFSEEDKLENIQLGPIYQGHAPLLLDEVCILDQALDASTIKNYYQALRSLINTPQN